MAGPFITLRRARDFQKLYDEGRAYHCQDFVLIVRHTGERPARVAFVTSRKVGNAVRRNRARRVLRAALRSLDELDLSQLEIHAAFVARASCAEEKTQVIRREMREVLGAAGLIGVRTRRG
jgi:ribonuclease P protein component